MRSPTAAQNAETTTDMGWESSNRRERLPANWPTIRRQVKSRAKGRCEATPHARGCGGWGTDADHITPGDNHHLNNLQWLSPACHRAKTAAEAAARNTAKADARQRPQEQHPGRTS